MKRSPLIRRTPLKSRGGSRFPEQVDEGFQEFVRQQPCVLAGRHSCWLPVQACHVIPKSRGVPDAANLSPGCVLAHAAQEGKTEEFERKYNLNLNHIARTLWDCYSSGGFDFYGGDAA